MQKPKNINKYLLGLYEFLEFVFRKSADGDTIRCLCLKCDFGKWKTKNIVHDHLNSKQLPQNYVMWNLHGEKYVKSSWWNLLEI